MIKNAITDVFFDLDHTLWDFEKNSELTFKKILNAHRITIPMDDFLAIYREVNLQYWKLYREEKISKVELRYKRLKDTFDALSYPVEDAVIDTLALAYITELPNYTHLFADTEVILTYLKPQYRLHIITNGFADAQDKKLKNSGIYHYFIHIINSESVGVKKPNPLIFNYALEKASVAPQQAMMIGDSLEADILGGQSVGMNTLHLNPNEMRHDHGRSIRTLSEIKQYL